MPTSHKNRRPSVLGNTERYYNISCVQHFNSEVLWHLCSVASRNILQPWGLAVKHIASVYIRCCVWIKSSRAAIGMRKYVRCPCKLQVCRYDFSLPQLSATQRTFAVPPTDCTECIRYSTIILRFNQINNACNTWVLCNYVDMLPVSSACNWFSYTGTAKVLRMTNLEVYYCVIILVCFSAPWKSKWT
jgi:hypothetical protein